MLLKRVHLAHRFNIFFPTLKFTKIASILHQQAQISAA